MINKIKALLRTAEEGGLEPEAAESYRAKAMALIAKHGIDQALVNDRGQREDKPECRQYVIKGSYGKRRVAFAYHVAEALRCTSILMGTEQKRSDYKLYVYGFGTDLDLFEMLWASLDLQLANELSKAVENKPARVHGRTFSANFIGSYADRVVERLEAIQNIAVQEVHNTEPGAALVLVKRSDSVQNLFKASHSRVRKSTTSSKFDPSGSMAGSAAGNRANLGLNAQVGGGSRALTR
jgi:uncharacterized protein DUF2786